MYQTSLKRFNGNNYCEVVNYSEQIPHKIEQKLRYGYGMKC